MRDTFEIWVPQIKGLVKDLLADFLVEVNDPSTRSTNEQVAFLTSTDVQSMHNSFTWIQNSIAVFYKSIENRKYSEFTIMLLQGALRGHHAKILME